jgi:hypothetical protein
LELSADYGVLHGKYGRIEEVVVYWYQRKTAVELSFGEIVDSQ